MTIEKLEARKIVLRREQAQLVASANAMSGAIQDCDFWIEQLKQQEAPSSPAANS